MKQIVKVGRVSISDRDGMIYLVYNVAGKKERESTGAEVNGTKLPGKVQARVKEINQSFAAQRGKATLAKLGVHLAELAVEQERVPLDEAVERSIQLAATQSDYYRDNLRAYAKYFQAFMKARYPAAGMPYWDEITKEHVIEFIQAKKAAGLSNKTIRNYVMPLLVTSKLYADIAPDVYREFRVDVRKYLPLKKKQITCLTLDQVLRLEPICNQSKSAFAAPMLYLGAMAGLNVAEIQSLQKKDWNGKEGVLTIRRAKNDNRPRKIPVAGRVRAWADKAFAVLDGKEAHLVTTGSGNPIALTDYKTMTRAFRRRILEPASKLENGECFTLSPSDCCRETFINLMVTAGIGDDLRRAYVGHAGKDSHTRNYANFDSCIVLREQVIIPLENQYPNLTSGPKVGTPTTHS
jgi:integrase